ncbi:MAG: hypothetical protein J6386_22580 [Candidatus Synoicihabitans palmerolidicus]|nr:hypothetical protein [Candidatus Synoicihabitans palmerolidicus]
MPPLDAHGTSAILDLQHVYSLQQAAELFAAFGWTSDASACLERATRIRDHIVATCWNESRGLIADTPDQQTFSQHANSYFLLTAAKGETKLTELATLVRDAPDLTPATFYFSFYTHQALVQAGLGDDYPKWLAPWRKVLDFGLTTVPDPPAPDARSDSHTWGSHPILGMLTTILGVTPAEPGFKSVRIAPHLGDLPFARSRIPHPLGDIHVDLQRAGHGGLIATVELPPGLTGSFHWQNREHLLSSGLQRFTFEHE